LTGLLKRSPKAQRQASQQPDPELEALEKAIAKRHEEESGKAAGKGISTSCAQKEVELDREIVASRDNYKSIQGRADQGLLAEPEKNIARVFGRSSTQ